MKFSTAKNVSMGMLLAGIIIGIIGAATMSPGTSEYTFTFIAMIVLVGLAFVILFIWSRCPKCGKVIIYQVYKLKNCPKCGAALKDTVKGERINRK